MAVVAIGVALRLAGDAGLGRARFGSMLVVSLTTGFVAAYVVDVLLVHRGVKAGTHDPREMAGHGHPD